MPRPIKNALREGLTYRDYWPEAARNVFTPIEARKEYNRMRRIANKRLQALGRNYPDSKLVQQYAAGFPSVKGEGDRRIYARLYEVSKFLGLKMASVSGMREYRKKSIATLHESGYDFVNEKNFDRFTDFMDEIRSHTDEREFEYQSEAIVELFERAEKEKADTDQIAESFQDYLDNEDKPLPKRKETFGMTREQVEKRQKPRTQEEKRKRMQLPGPLGSSRGNRRSMNRETSKRRRK